MHKAKTYEVEVWTTTTQTLTIEAESAEAARAIAYGQVWYSGIVRRSIKRVRLGRNR